MPTELLGVNDRAAARRGRSGVPQTACRRAHACRRDVRGSGALRCARHRSPVGRDVFIDVDVVLEGECARRPRADRSVRLIATARSVRRPRYSAEQRDRSRGGRPRMPDRAVRTPATRGAVARRRACRQFRRGQEDQMKRSAKANHLTYLGDTTVGEKANVGAGTDDVQLRRREQVTHGNRRPRLHRLRHHARRTGQGRCRRDDRSGSTITKDAPPASSRSSAASS